MAGAPHPKPKRRPKAATRQAKKWTAGARARDAVTARSGGLCELALECCTVKATHHHHRLLRAQGGKDTEDNFLHLCERCHSAVHASPEESYRRGWLLRSTDDLSPFVRPERREKGRTRW